MPLLKGFLSFDRAIFNCFLIAASDDQFCWDRDIPKPIDKPKGGVRCPCLRRSKKKKMWLSKSVPATHPSAEVNFAEELKIYSQYIITEAMEIDREKKKKRVRETRNTEALHEKEYRENDSLTSLATYWLIRRENTKNFDTPRAELWNLESLSFVLQFLVSNSMTYVNAILDLMDSILSE